MMLQSEWEKLRKKDLPAEGASWTKTRGQREKQKSVQKGQRDITGKVGGPDYRTPRTPNPA